MLRFLRTMKILSFFLMLFISFSVFADTKETKPKTALSGFVRNDIIFDSRQNYEALDGTYTLLPKPQELDSNNEDIQAQSSVRMVNILSRLNVKVSGVTFLNADVFGMIEFDAAATSAEGGTNEMRFRHAYSKLTWENTSVILGTTWHPLFVEKCFPVVLNTNTGVPFQPFNRMPQLRITQQLGQSFSLLGAASYQAQYESNGPDGPSSKYQRQAMIPNLDVQISYSNKNVTAGAGYDYKIIKPYLSTTGTEGTFVSNETLSSNAYIAYIVAKASAFHVKAKFVFGENMHDQLLPGGYAAYEVDEKTGAEKFTNSSLITTFIQATYMKNAWNVSLMGGYLKNLGFENNPLSDYMYTRTPEVHQAWRVTTDVHYMVNRFRLSLEYEATTADYGTIDYNDRGLVKDAISVCNHRINFATTFFF